MATITSWIPGPDEVESSIAPVDSTVTLPGEPLSDVPEIPAPTSVEPEPEGYVSPDHLRIYITGFNDEEPAPSTADWVLSPDEVAEPDEPNIRGPVNRAIDSGVSPDKAARALQLSGETGYGHDYVVDNFDEFERESKVQSVDEATRNSPTTRRFMQDDIFASVALDDTPNLVKTEGLFTQFWRGVTDYFAAAGRDVSRSGDFYEQGEIGVERGYLGRSIVMADLGLDVFGVTEKQRARFDQLSTMRGQEAETFLGGIVTTTAEDIPMLIEQFKGMGVGGIAGALLLGIPTAGRLAGTGLKVGAKGGGTVVSAELEIGNAYSEFVNIKDISGRAIDKESAAMAAILAGTVNAGLEMVSLKKTLGNIPGVERVLGRLGRESLKEALQSASVRQNLKKVARRYAEVAATESAVEATSEVVLVMTGQILKMIDGGEFAELSATEVWERVSGALVAGLQSGIGTNLPGSVASGVYAVRQANEARAHQKHMADVVEAAQESLLRNRSPEDYQQFLQAVTDDSEAGPVLLHADPMISALQESGADVEAWFTDLGVSPDKVQRALQTGGDIEIDRATFVTSMPDNNFQEQALVNVRQDPGALTMAQVELARAQVKDRISKAAEDATLATDPAGSEPTESDVAARQFGEAVAQQVRKTGRYSAKGASQIGELYESMVRTIARDYEAEGKTFDIEQFGESMGIRVFGPRAQAEAEAAREQILEFGRLAETPDPLDTTNDKVDWANEEIIVSDEDGAQQTLSAFEANRITQERLRNARDLLDCVRANS